MSVTSSNDWEASKAAFAWPKVLNKQRKSVFVNKSATEASKITLQLCESNPDSYIRVPWNPAPPQNPAGDDSDKYTVSLSIRNPTLEAKIRAFEEEIIKFAMNDSEKCFGKVLSEETIRDKFVSPFRELDEGNILRLKMSMNPNNVKIMVLQDCDAATKKMTCCEGDVNDISMGCHVMPIVDISPLWFINGFGYSMHVTQLVVKPNGASGGIRSNNDGNFIMANGFTMEVVTKDEPETKRPSPVTESNPAKRPRIITDLNGANISASLEAEATGDAIPPSHYLTN